VLDWLPAVLLAVLVTVWLVVVLPPTVTPAAEMLTGTLALTTV
jgi:hypothetical protein